MFSTFGNLENSRKTIIPKELLENNLPLLMSQYANKADRKSTRLNSSHGYISYAVFCLKKKNKKNELYIFSNSIKQQ